MSEKWWDMSDEELDDLFREASDKAEIPFDSLALDKLRQKIDFKSVPQPEPNQGFKKRRLALAGLLFFFFGLALLYIFSKVVGEKIPTTANNLSNTQKSEVIVDKNNFSKIKNFKSDSTDANVIESKIAHDKTPNTIGNSGSKISNEQTNKKGAKLGLPLEKTALDFEKTNGALENNLLKNKPLEVSNTKSIDKKKLITTHQSKDNNSTIIKVESSGNAVNIVSSSKTNRKPSRLAKSKFHNNRIDSPSVYQQTSIPISTSLIVQENKSAEAETTREANFYHVDFLTNKATKLLETNVQSESPTYVDYPAMTIKQPKFSRFGVRFAMAPEINSIEKMETSAVVGSMFGLLLEYRLTKKLTLQTGVNFSKKKYTGNFEYYRAWTGGTAIKPLTVDGICSVVDIPINLRLNAFQMNRNTFFISGGVSSYLMSDEIYTYNYAWGPPKIRDWTGNSASFYWSTLNLSVGVERKINKHFTLQIEPFLKTPLVGVGRGSVNLYSSGLLFSTKYEF